MSTSDRSGSRSTDRSESGGGVEAVQAVLLGIIVVLGLAYGVYQTVAATTALFAGQ
jgi:hypothetical protein